VKIPTEPSSSELTTGQVATLLGISTERVRQLAREDRLPHRNSSLGRLYRREDVEAFDKSRQQSRNVSEAGRD
jgi:excisionase family DNA binding protein